MRKPQYSAGNLAGELARLPALDRDELLEWWKQVYGSEPPARISKQLLVRAIAYKMQENVLGGLKPATKRFLAKVVEDNAMGKQFSASPVTVIKPGTRLIREWHGVTYEVEITENGILFKGKHHRSLSEVARLITGVKWSGPLFFGLKSMNKGAA